MKFAQHLRTHAGVQYPSLRTGPVDVYNNALKDAKYIDLTHAFHPTQAVWPGFGNAKFKPSIAGRTFEGFEGRGRIQLWHAMVCATAYELTTDQYGSDPSALRSPLGATISDLPPTHAVRPLVVINIADKVEKDVNYHTTVADIAQWEKAWAHPRLRGDGALRLVQKRATRSAFRADPTRRATGSAQVSASGAQDPVSRSRAVRHRHTPDFASETWILKNDYTQAEGVANLDKVPERGALIAIGFATPLGGTGGFGCHIAIAPKTGSAQKYGVTIKRAPVRSRSTPAIAPVKRDGHGVMPERRSGRGREPGTRSGDRKRPRQQDRRVDRANVRTTAERHRQFELFLNDFERFGHPLLAHGAQRVEPRTAGALCAQRGRAKHILTAADAAVHMDLDFVAYLAHDGRKRPDGCPGAVELATTVIADDQGRRRHSRPRAWRLRRPEFLSGSICRPSAS